MLSIAEATTDNNAFSRRSPGLQIAIDSHSLGAAKTCFRLYYYTIILGYQPREQSPHLTFGLLLHKGREVYYHVKASGQGHEDSLLATIEWALDATWNDALRRPWISDHPEKNRLSLLRTLVWYLDKYGANDPLETVILQAGPSAGKPAVELMFRFDSGLETASGEEIQFCGYLDRLARLNDQVYIDDLKTTRYALSTSWFNSFTPYNQFSMYCLAGQVVWKEPVQGLILDGAQIGATFSRFERQLVPRPPEVLDEWVGSTARWLRMLEACAEEGQRLEATGGAVEEAWPMNESSCGNYGGCQFRGICSKAPKARQTWLDAGFRRRVWDPTVARGDI
jgi:hypothetical protein